MQKEHAMGLKINKELLCELISERKCHKRFQVVSDTICDISRWSVHHDCILFDAETGKYYDASYSEGATEMQDESPFEYEPVDSEGNIELKVEVEPYEETVTKYREKTNE